MGLIWFGDTVSALMPSSAVARRSHVVAVSSLLGARCIACLLCVFACPADCIWVSFAGAGVWRGAVSGWILDRKRCIVCGSCNAVCPVVAIAELTDARNLNGRTMIESLG